MGGGGIVSYNSMSVVTAVSPVILDPKEGLEGSKPGLYAKGSLSYYQAVMISTGLSL